METETVLKITVFLCTVAFLTQMVHIRSLQKEIRRLKESAEMIRRLRQEAERKAVSERT